MEWIRDGPALGGGVAAVGGRLHGVLLVGGTGEERGGRGRREVAVVGWGIVCVCVWKRDGCGSCGEEGGVDLGLFPVQ